MLDARTDPLPPLVLWRNAAPWAGGCWSRPGRAVARREQRRADLAGNAKSQMLQTAGFIKLVREKDGPIVGVHMLGARVGELIGEGQVMVNWEAYLDDVARLVHAHPTQNDAIGEAALALAGKPLHVHD